MPSISANFFNAKRVNIKCTSIDYSLVGLTLSLLKIPCEMRDDDDNSGGDYDDDEQRELEKVGKFVLVELMKEKLRG